MIFTTMFIDSFSQDWQWSHQIGSDYMFYGERARVISDGNDVFLIGSYGGTLYLPNHTLQSNGNNDIFIAKFDAAGSDLWAKSLGGNYPQPDYLEDASGVYDKTCNCIYVAGTFKNTIDFGGGISLNASSGASDNFLARMELDGTFRWAKRFGGNGKERTPIINVNRSGKIYILAQVEDSSWFDSFHTGSGGIMAQYDSSGNCLSAEFKFTAPVTGNTNGVFLDFIRTDLIIYGAFRSIPFQLDTAMLTTNGSYDAFISRMDSIGHMKWIKNYGNGGVDYFQNISHDDSNNIYVIGGFKDSINLDGNVLYNTNGSDILFAKLDSSGIFIWVKQAYVSGINSSGNSIQCDSVGNCYVACDFSGTALLDTFHLSTTNARDMCISRFNSNGNILGVRHFGDATCFNSTVDGTGSVYCTGAFNNSITIGADNFTALLGQDIWFAKIDAFTGIEEGERRSNQLLIYANPNEGKCSITVPDEFRHEKNLTLSIYDAKGTLIQQGSVQMNDDKVRVNIEQQAKGVYNVTLGNGKKNYSGKIIFE